MYLICIILVLSILFYILYLRPVFMMKRCQKEFEKAGYRVKRLPYNPILFPAFMIYFQDYQKHKDCLYHYKNQYQAFDVLVSNIGTQTFVRFHHPELIKQYFSRERQWCYKKYDKRLKFIDPVLGQGLVRSEGQNWHRKRKILNKVFTYDLILKMGPMIQNICEYVFDKFDKGQTQGIVYKSDQMLAQITSNVILQGFLGSEFRNEKIENISASQFLLNLTADRNLQIMNKLSWFLGPQFLKLGLRENDRDINRRTSIFQSWIKLAVHQLISQEKQRLKKEQKSGNIISALMQKQNLDEGEKSYSEEQMVNEFKTFFNAGTDTSSHLIQAAIYYIARNPQKQTKLREEIQKVLQNPHSKIDIQQIKTLKYLDSFLKQTLRLSGPANVSFSRSVILDHEIGGAKIYKGFVVQPASMWPHFSSDYYKEPLEFRPERWLNGECEELNPFAYVPFYSGARSCIGKQLALLESKIVLIRFLMRYKKVEIIEEKVGFFIKFVFQTQNYHLRLQK